MTRTTEYKSPLGRMLLAVDEEGLTGAWFEGQKYLPEGVAPENEETALPPVLESACRWLDLYFSGQEPGFHAAAASGRDSIPPGGLGTAAEDPLRQNDHLRCAGKAAGSGDRQAGVGAGSGRRSGA